MLPLLISMKLFFKENDKIFVNRYIFLLTIILCFIAIYYSGERTSILIITTYFVGYIIFVLKLPLTKKILLLSGLILSVTVIIISSETLKKRVIDLTISNLSFYKDKTKFLDTNENQFVNPENIHQNIKHLIVAKQIFKEKPILGHGNKMFGKICFEKYFVDDGRCSTHPHNFLAQVLVENGIIGGIFLFNVIFLFFKICHSF